MKKLLFFVLTAALMFGCKKDDNSTPCPVSGATLPTSSAENPIPAGSAVTIQGSGFTDNSEIWLRGVATKADGDVQAAVTGFTSTSITFTAPSSVSGEQSIILRQDGGEWPLGKMYFAAAPEILPKKIVKVITTYEDAEETAIFTDEFSYDESGRLIRINQTNSDDSKYESTITYAENQVTLTETDLQNDGSTETHTFRLNNGRAESYVYEDNSDGSDYKYETELSYGENGYLAGYVGKSTDGTTGTGTLTTDETGFLTKISGRYEYEDEEDNETYTLDFVPNTSVRNNLNLDLMYIDEIADFDEPAIFTGHLLGVCGKRTTCLPQQYTSTWSNEEETGSMTYKYDYVFNGEYISKIVIVSDYGDKTTLELFYEE